VILLSTLAAFTATWLLIPRHSAARVHNLNTATTAIPTIAIPTIAIPTIAIPTIAGRVRALLIRVRGESALARSRREDTIAAIGALAAELRAGTTPAQALAITGGSPPVWPHTHAAALHHGDISTALILDSREIPELSALNACWRVGIHSGSGLATSVSRLALSLREAQETRFQLEAELAGPRATARMLALLPAVGIGLGYLMGAQPLTWLISNPLGWLSLVVGVSLTGVGVWWTSAIAAKVERML
jgi:tight adherence protein B